MKNFTKIIGLFLFISWGAHAQQEKGIVGANNWLNNWTEFKPNKVDYGQANRILAGNITINTRLEKKNIYLLQGNVYVTNGATLTIDPGTIILCDSESKASLVIAKGATIIAEGLETDPIIFTSNKSIKRPGDWGGIILLGEAPINKLGGISSINLDLDPTLISYGGTKAVSNSGVLKFVRIEFAGARLKGMDKFNSLLLAGVGTKTIIENIMVSYSGGHSFEILGGELKLNKLISFKSSSNDYSFNFGTQCHIDNSLAIRSSFLSSKYGSRCLDIASYNTKEEVDHSKKQTIVVATNLTLVNSNENIKDDIESGLIKEAIYVGNDSALECRRTVISGFNPAVLLDSKIEINDNNLNKIKFEEMYFNLCKGNIFTEFDPNNEDLEGWYGNSIFANVYSKSDNNETFIDFANDKRPDFRLRIGKIYASSVDK